MGAKGTTQTRSSIAGTPTSARKAAARDMIRAATLPVWSTATNSPPSPLPCPQEVVVANLRHSDAVTVPDLRRAAARLTAVSSLELLDLSFFGGRCTATFHAAATERFL